MFSVRHLSLDILFSEGNCTTNYPPIGVYFTTGPRVEAHSTKYPPFSLMTTVSYIFGGVHISIDVIMFFGSDLQSASLHHVRLHGLIK